MAERCCGTGHLTRKNCGVTDGIVVGIDSSNGMIAEAQRNSAPDIVFQVGDTESLGMIGQFDVIFAIPPFNGSAI